MGIERDGQSGALLSTQLSLPGRRQGKVRDLYDLRLEDGRDALLIVATDRVSAFDVVLEGGIPDKGVALTRLACFWFDALADTFAALGISHHLLSTDVDDVPGLTAEERTALRGRVMVARRVSIVPVECVARGYLAGSGWKDYQASGAVCGHRLPEGLVDGAALDHPLFTPATKAAEGHDENISFEEMASTIGAELAERLRTTTLTLYDAARRHAAQRGILLADTKLEFGQDAAGGLVLADEIFTPDSSRFWPADAWTPGGEQASFDKQFVRDWLETLVAEGRWDKAPPGPRLPEEIVRRTLDRYDEAHARLTGPVTESSPESAAGFSEEGG